MSSKNTWDGLQFRVMETIEKAKGVPLTALEISQRLHETEYKHELKDNVVFKVTRACHSMREKGRIIVTDARDREGRLTYALPQRVIFPRKDEDMPPANPVLSADIAEKIKPAEPKPEPKAPSKFDNAAWGVQEKVLALLDAAPYPLASTEVRDVATKEKWWPDANADVNQGVAGTLYHLSESKQVFRLPSSKRVPKVKYEYATRKTGKSAPPVAAVTTTPKPAPAPKVEKPAAGPVFRPVAPKAMAASITLSFDEDRFHKINATARSYSMTSEEFCRQAIDFALSHTE